MMTIHHVDCSLQGELDLQVTTHSSIFIPDKDGADSVRIANIMFVLSDSADAIVVAIDEEEGSRVQMWELHQQEVSSHKLFAAQLALPSSKLVPSWRFAEEFGGSSSRLVTLTTPRYSCSPHA
jgi:hypothetical protein